MQLRESEVAFPNELQGISFEHLLDAKKSNLQTAVTTITDHVTDGNYDSLKALILAKKGSEFFSLLEKSVRPLAEDNYVFKIDKDFSLHDVKVEQSEAGVKYDYSGCGDSEWDELNLQLSELDAKIKEREKFLKAVTKPLEVVDTTSGETFTIQPPIRTAKLGLKLTIK